MSGKDLAKHQTIMGLVCTLLVISTVALLYRQGGLKQFSYQLYDLHFKWRGPEQTSGKIVLVLMDEQSARELQRTKGGWSRQHTALALTNLCNAGAEVIGLDILYSAPDQDPETDIALAEAMAACNNVVLARTTSALSGQNKAALPVFQDAMIGDGFIEMPLDQDEILRKIYFLNAKPLADGSLQLLPSFSLELARSFLFIDFLFDFSDPDTFTIGDPEGNSLHLPYPELRINYSGDSDTFTQLSFVDVVKNHFPKDAVQGKLIIIGSSLFTDKDHYTTPFSKAELIPQALRKKFGHIVSDTLGQQESGVACHAHAVETILSRKFISEVQPALLTIAIAVAGLLCLLFYIPAITLLVECVILSGFLAGIFLAGHFLFLKSNVWFDTAPVLMVVCIQFITAVILQKAFDREKTAMVTKLFGNYVSSGVVKELIEGDIDATFKTHRRELTILFSDLRNFTTISEKLGATDTSVLLNAYFDAMIPLVFSHHGTLDKLMGDAIMAFFGAPQHLPGHANAAAMTALDMIQTLKVFNETSKIRGADTLDVGVGLNTGEVTVGNLGSQDFMDYTIIGDAVNLGSRLEGLNKVYGTHILTSEFTAAQLDDRFLLRELDLIRVKGKLKAITLYELLGIKSDHSDKELAMVKLFSDGLASFRQQDWKSARTLFQKIIQDFPEDRPSLLYLDRIKRYQVEPPPADWDGVTIFSHK